MSRVGNNVLGPGLNLLEVLSHLLASLDVSEAIIDDRDNLPDSVDDLSGVQALKFLDDVFNEALDLLGIIDASLNLVKVVASNKSLNEAPGSLNLGVHTSGDVV